MILETQPQAAFPWQMLAILGAFIVFYYFLFIRPQSKKRKDLQNMLNNLKKGDKVITIGGIHGKVSSTKENEVTLRVDANTEITFDRNAISRVVVDQPAKTKQVDKNVEQAPKEKKSFFGFGKK
jgi:preprotein translocase subunit YajC